MVFLNVRMEDIAAGLADYGFTPSDGNGVGVSVGSIQPVAPANGELWLSTSDNQLSIYNGVDWQSVSLTPTEQEQLGSLSTIVTLAQNAQNEAEAARDTILGVTVATGAEGTNAVWNPAQGLLTIPVGDTGDVGADGISVDHLTRTAGTGAQGTTDTYTMYGDVAETIVMGTFDVYNGADGAGSGDMTKAVYDTTNNGVVDNAEKVNSLTVDTAVPAGAVFTDTTYAPITGTTGGVLADSDAVKFAGIEAGATADQTGAEIKVAYELEADTNAYTDAEKTKLAGIATGAEVNDANTTTQGNTFNGVSQLVQLDASGKLPAVDGSNLTNLPSSGGGSAIAMAIIFG